jgi:hypothetical protein
MKLPPTCMLQEAPSHPVPLPHSGFSLLALILAFPPVASLLPHLWLFGSIFHHIHPNPASTLFPSDPLPTGISSIAIALGYGHTCVIVTEGGVKCWGYNDRGQLGIGSTNNQYSPSDVPGVIFCMIYKFLRQINCSNFTYLPSCTLLTTAS